MVHVECISKYLLGLQRRLHQARQIDASKLDEGYMREFHIVKLFLFQRSEDLTVALDTDSDRGVGVHCTPPWLKERESPPCARASVTLPTWVNASGIISIDFHATTGGQVRGA